MDGMDGTWTGDVTAETFDEPAFLKRLMGDRALAQRILRRFVEHFPCDLQKLTVCAAEGDLQPARVQAHSMKGASASVSAEELRAAALQAEQAAAQGDLAAVRKAVPEIAAAFERFKTAVMAMQ